MNILNNTDPDRDPHCWPWESKLIEAVLIYVISFFVTSLHFNHACTHKQML